jgi:hypothetical protein
MGHPSSKAKRNFKGKAQLQRQSATSKAKPNFKGKA